MISRTSFYRKNTLKTLDGMRKALNVGASFVYNRRGKLSMILFYEKGSFMVYDKQWRLLTKDHLPNMDIFQKRVRED